MAAVSGSETIRSEALEDLGNLKAISKHGVGVDNTDLDVATQRGVVVTNAPGSNKNAVADFTVGLMLFPCARGMNGFSE